MPFSVNEVIEVLQIISTEENLQMTVYNSARGAVISGICTFVGGVIAGPPGLALGGAAGGIGAALTSKSFKPLSEVIEKMPDHKKQALSDRIRKVLSKVDHTDVIALIAIIQGSATLRLHVLDAMKTYFSEIEGTPIS